MNTRPAVTNGLRAALLAAAMAAPAQAETPREPIEIPPGSGVIDEFLGCPLPGGGIELAAPIPQDMPWRIAIGLPRKSPRHGSRKDARQAAVESMQLWERSIQTRLPWFKLEFSEKDADAPIQIEWKRRTAGNRQGQAGPVCTFEGSRIRAGGRMEIAIQSCPTCQSLTSDQIRLLVTHEFGHILGLGHCLSCDSSMNYSWQTEGRTLVTQVDLDAVERRFAEAPPPPAMPPPTPSAPPAALDLVDRAENVEPIAYAEVTCKRPFPLTRSCSRSRGAKKRAEIESLDLRLAGSKDGRILLVVPEDSLERAEFGTATGVSNESFYIVSDGAERAGVAAVRATALLAGRQVVGYLIEFDGDAWKALDL